MVSSPAHPRPDCVQLRYAPLARPLHAVVTLHFALRVSSLLYYIPTTFLSFLLALYGTILFPVEEDIFFSLSLFFHVEPTIRSLFRFAINLRI